MKEKKKRPGPGRRRRQAPRRKPAALRRASEEWRKILDAVPEPIMLVDPQGRVTRANRAAAELLGAAPEDLAGQPCFLDHPEAADPLETCPHLQTQNDGLEHRAEVRSRRLGRDFLVTTTPLSDAAGARAGSVHLLRDITEHKQADESLQRTAAELKRSNQEFEEFAQVIAHDLQEPLRMVDSYLDLLQRRYQEQLDRPAREFIAFALDGSRRMQQMIRDLLSYARVGTQGAAFQRTDSGAVLDQALGHLQLTIAETAAELSRDPLPVVMADPMQLMLLFQNLVGNALKFHGASPPRVHLSAAAQGAEWLFSVRDHGIGIAPEYAERIFLILQRLHGPDEYPGTGIGLAICKKIVERHGGRIWVESALGQGAAFFFTLPRREEKE